MVVLGISTDKPVDSLSFKKRHLFPFPLLCDVDRKVSMAYGAAGFEKAYYSNRMTYLIDENGIISKVYKKVIPSNHAEELLKLL